MEKGEFNTTLLRERFVISDTSGQEEMIVALSNRIVLPLYDKFGAIAETFIIRAHTMAISTSLAAQIAKSYEKLGPIATRQKKFNWDKCWGFVNDQYEQNYNPKAWCAIYHDGKKIFSTNEYHILLDLIEQFENKNKQKYEKSLEMAEQALKDAGQSVKISYDSNVALIIKCEKKVSRVGIVIRSPKRTNTFNLTAKQKTTDHPLSPSACLQVASSFLDAIQLSYVIGSLNERIKRGMSSWRTNDDKQRADAHRKLHMMESLVTAFIGGYDVNFRPERPEFHLLIEDAALQTKEYLDEIEKQNEDENEEYIQ